MAARRAARHCERATHRTQRACQRELSRKFPIRKRLNGDLPAGGENAERDWQIETAGFLRKIGGRQIDRDANCRLEFALGRTRLIERL
jgi:hypothetical protein